MAAEQDRTRSGRFILFHQLSGMHSAVTTMAQIEAFQFEGVSLDLLRKLEKDFRDMTSGRAIENIPPLTSAETMTAANAFIVITFMLNTLAAFFTPEESAEAKKLGFHT